MVKKKKLTAFEKLAAKRGVDLEAERKRAIAQKQAGQKIRGTTRETLVRQRAQETFKRQEEAAKPTTPFKKTVSTAKPLKELQFKGPEQQAKEQIPGAILAGITLLPGGKVLKGGKILTGSKAAAVAAAARGKLVKAAVAKVKSGQAAAVAAADKARDIFVRAAVAKVRRDQTAVALKSQIGKIDGIIAKGLRGGVATNTVTETLTKSYLSRLAKAARNPIVVASALLAAIGTYPFAGFIREEALQTLSFGVRSAIQNNDIGGAEMALEQQKDILNPEIVDQILSGIPFVNILKELVIFFDAARTKIKIDEQVVADMKIQIETGEDDAAYWKRVKEEEDEQKRAYKTWAIEQEAQANKNEREFRKLERESKLKDEKKAYREAAEFWAEDRAKRRQKEAADRKAIADFWIAYRKRVLEIAEDNRPSNLNFGLLG